MSERRKDFTRERGPGKRSWRNWALIEELLRAKVTIFLEEMLNTLQGDWHKMTTFCPSKEKVFSVALKSKEKSSVNTADFRVHLLVVRVSQISMLSERTNSEQTIAIKNQCRNIYIIV